MNLLTKQKPDSENKLMVGGGERLRERDRQGVWDGHKHCCIQNG